MWVVRMVGGDFNQLRIDFDDDCRGAKDNDASSTAFATTATTTERKMSEVAAADPYELKLFQMFQSCSDCSGNLDEPALHLLCESLELHDKGAPLIAGLVADGEKPARISFLRFKEALLNFLGTELDGTASAKQAKARDVENSERICGGGNVACITRERSLVISDDVEAYIDSPPEQSDREVSPKLVVGAKKYGRRSRPQMQPVQDEHAHTDSDHGLATTEETEDSSVGGRDSQRGSNYQLAQRSSSQTDIPGEGGSSSGRRRRPPTLNGTKLKRCSSLPAQRNLQAPKAASKTLTKSGDAGQTQAPLGSSVESLGVECRLHYGMWNAATRYEAAATAPYSNGHIYSTTGRTSVRDAPTLLETLPAHSIVDIWERAHIANGRGILLALGFDEDDVNLVQLHKVLEEELRGVPDDEPHTMLLRASHALQSIELQSLRQMQRQLHDENAKLLADNKDANRRVAMLAVEIDERHASLEDTAQKEVRLLEQRHAVVVRELTARMANDREHWTQLTARLEARIKTFEQDEIRLKTDVELVHKENDALEEEQQKLQRQIAELLEQNIQLNEELAELAESHRRVDGEAEAGATDAALATKRDENDDELLRLMEKVTALSLENTGLRDKNDELVVEVENLNLELVRTKTKLKKATAVARTEFDLATDGDVDDGEQAGSATAMKRRGDSPSKTRITEEESPRLGKLRKCANETGASETGSDTSGEWMPLNSELKHSAAAETAVSAVELMAGLKKNISTLEEQLRMARQSLSSSERTPPPTASTAGSVSPTADERCKELEASLEQMQRAYEDCEDYWQSKLSEERQLFEKERQIYEDEQQENDRKFTELMEKVREYEEQFSKDGRLSPIEEKDLLEQQYTDLEAEIDEMRARSRLLYEEKCKEVDTLQCEVEDLRLRLGESVEILTGACQLNTEAVEAGAAAGAVNTQSAASSPISYLWHQSTIQEPAKNYSLDNSSSTASLGKQSNRIHLSTSETTIFSTTPVDATASTNSISSSSMNTISPIQKPNAGSNNHRTTLAVESEGDAADCDSSSTASGRSFETHSIGSTHSAQQQRAQVEQSANDTNNTETTATTTTATAKTTTTSQNDNNSCTSPSPSPSPSGIKEELKRLKFFQISLKEQIKDLSLQRDGLVMELQQLQEARPVLEKAYARAAHPSLIQRVNQLELKNRHLQNVIKQQQQYTESLMQQSWRQHQMELSDLHGRIEAQGGMMSEQVQRLQNADILVKDLYVENAHLTATVQRMEQQRMRVNLMHQQQHAQHQPHQPLAPPSGRAHVLPGMP